jgi:hypothetical protein
MNTSFWQPLCVHKVPSPTEQVMQQSLEQHVYEQGDRWTETLTEGGVRIEIVFAAPVLIHDHVNED